MGRPSIFDCPMTPAERMRRYRAKKREPGPPPEGLSAVIRTQKDFARYVNRSVRQIMYHNAFIPNRLIEWDGDVIDGRYGKVGMAFLAEVCRLGDASAPQVVHDAIKARRGIWSNGVAALEEGRALGRG